MKFINLIGVGLVLCGLASPVLAAVGPPPEPKAPDLVVELFRNGVRLNNVLVHLDIKKECSPFPWQISPWSFPDGTYYGDLSGGPGTYSVQVQNFLFGTTYGSCKAFFNFNGTSQAQIELHIGSYPPLPRDCAEIICPPDED